MTTSNPKPDPFRELLSGYLDGDWDEAIRSRVEAHVADCRECRDLLAELGRIASAAREYQGTPPERDGWPSIRRAIEADRVVPFPRRSRPSRSLGWRHVMAAGLVMAAAGLGGGWYWFGRGGDEVARVVVSEPTVGALVVGLTSAAYDTAVAELQRTLTANRGRLDTATVRSVEQSLAAIDRAIAEARAAIQRDTANGYLNGQIAANLRRKLSLLRLATRAIASES